MTIFYAFADADDAAVLLCTDAPRLKFSVSNPKVLLEACPKCVEERYIHENNNSSDNRSVGSRRSTKSDNRSVSSRHSTRSDNSRHSNKSNHRSSSVATTSRVASSSSSAVRSPSAPRSGGGKKNTNSAEKSTMARYECPFGEWLLECMQTG